MYATLDEVRASNVINIAGVSNDSTEFTRYVNEAVRKILRRGDFAGTTPLIRVCVRKGCVVFPRYVKSVRRINLCSSPVEMRGLWYNFLPREGSGDGCQTLCGDTMHGTFVGRAPVYQDIWGEGWYVRTYIDCPADVNKTVTIFGEDNNGQPYKEVLTLKNAYVQSNRAVRRIDRVLKDETACLVRLYAYNPTTEKFEDLAVYEPSETNPSYAKYRLSIPGCAASTSATSCGSLQSIVALVKLNAVPVKYGTDLVLVENIDAIKDMIYSSRCGEAGDSDGKANFEASAIRELNLELGDELPDDQIPVTNEPLGGLGIGSQQCF